MNFKNIIKSPFFTHCRIQSTQMFSNVTKPLDGKIAIVTASTEG